MPAFNKNSSITGFPGLAWWPFMLASRLGLCVLGFVFAASALATEAPSPAQGERLGTLFYSAAERSAIVLARQNETAAVVKPSSVVNVSGIVKRQHGNSTVWINGQAVPEGQTVAPAARTTISITGATLDGQHVRVGETVDIDTHERADIVAPGAVTIKGRK